MSSLAERLTLLWAVHHVDKATSPEQFAAEMASVRAMFSSRQSPKTGAAVDFCSKRVHSASDSIGVNDAVNPAPITFNGSVAKTQKDALALLEARLTEVTNRLSAVVMAYSVAILKQSPENIAGRLIDIDRDVLVAARNLRAEFLVFNSECIDVLTELERLLLDGKDGELDIGKAG